MLQWHVLKFDRSSMHHNMYYMFIELQKVTIRFRADLEVLTLLIKQGPKNLTEPQSQSVEQHTGCLPRGITKQWKVKEGGRARDLATDLKFQTSLGNKSVLIQLAQCRFHGLANWHAKVLIDFSNKIYGCNFIKQHSETVMVRNYQNADCSLRNFFYLFVLFISTFGTLSFLWHLWRSLG